MNTLFAPKMNKIITIDDQKEDNVCCCCVTLYEIEALIINNMII